MNENEVLTGNEALQNAFNDFSARINTDGQPSTESVEPENADTEPKVQQPVTEQPTPANKAFAQLRTDNANMAQQIKAIEAVLKNQGYANIQDYLTKQNEQQVVKQAEKQGISPELEKRIQTLEQENMRYKQNERMNNLKNEVGVLVQKYGITKEGWDTFIGQLQSNNIDPLKANVPLETLYMQYNYESIFNARLEKEKQSWMQAQNNVETNAPISTPAGKPTPQTNPDNKSINWKTMAEQFKKTK